MPPWSPGGPCGPSRLGSSRAPHCANTGLPSPPVPVGGPRAPPGRGGGGGGDFIAVTRGSSSPACEDQLIPHLGRGPLTGLAGLREPGAGRRSRGIFLAGCPGGSAPLRALPERRPAFLWPFSPEGGPCRWSLYTPTSLPRTRTQDRPGPPARSVLHRFFFPQQQLLPWWGKGAVQARCRKQTKGLEGACSSPGSDCPGLSSACPALAEAKTPEPGRSFSERRGAGLWRASSQPVPGSATRRDGGICPSRLSLTCGLSLAL